MKILLMTLLLGTLTAFPVANERLRIVKAKLRLKNPSARRNAF